MTNKALARHLALAADLVELTGGNAFRSRAFAQAARAVERLDRPAEPLVLDGTITDVPGIGRGLAADLAEFVATGSTRTVAALLEALPPGIPDVLRVKGLGVKKVRQLWHEAGVVSLDSLEVAAASGRLADLGGFGDKTVQNILASIEQLRSYAGRAHLRDAWREARSVCEVLRAAGFAAEPAGEVRRQCNVVAQVEVVAAGALLAVAEALRTAGLASRPDAGDVGEAPAGGVPPGGDQSVAATLPNGQGLTVWTVAPERFARALWSHTGPDAHVAAVEARADAGAFAAATTEAAIYAAAGLSPIPPPLRDDDWFAEAEAGTLPALLGTADLRGTVHNHTTASDGAHTLREMTEAAHARGLGYFGVCDHSQSLKIANGLTPARLEAQIADVAALNAKGGPVRVFSGSEVDILADGRMDFADDLLARLDVVVASVHTGFSMSVDEATARVVRAVSNPHVDILGHATGRLLLRREGYPLDHAAVLDACGAHGVAVELNANPWRLDMDWSFIRAARARGLYVSINPDAHAVDGLDDTAWGVASAQKGGLTAEGSLTSLDADAFAAWLTARG
ncbi:MAG TPA: helix-hairpin-helix domain-containing protein [Rubricoccaceae bacterium]